VSKVLEIIPLGGIGEFGMNCTLLRFGDEMIVVDAGMGFPEESVYGVDVCIPDFEILEQYRDEITAIILTHGHEDHLGALPYLLKKINVPVYASHFTLGLAESKLDEHELLNDVLLHRVEPRDVTLDRAALFELANPVRHRGLRETHLLGDGHLRGPRVVLDKRQDLIIYRIKGAHTVILFDLASILKFHIDARPRCVKGPWRAPPPTFRTSERRFARRQRNSRRAAAFT